MQEKPEQAKVPILPGSEGVLQTEEEALEWAKSQKIYALNVRWP
jgi:biotin carboxylase